MNSFLAVRRLAAAASRLPRASPPPRFASSVVVAPSPPRPTAFTRRCAVMASPTDAPPDFAGPGADELRALCVGACSRDTPLLTPAELATHLKSLPAWRLTDDGTCLERAFKARTFSAAAAWIAAVAPIADALGHHPDVAIAGWNVVTVRVTTHAAGGVTLADAALAARLDAVPCEYSPKWLREQAAAKGGE